VKVETMPNGFKNSSTSIASQQSLAAGEVFVNEG
jgi:hypothetical protein